MVRSRRIERLQQKCAFWTGTVRTTLALLGKYRISYSFFKSLSICPHCGHRRPGRGCTIPIDFHSWIALPRAGWCGPAPWMRDSFSGLGPSCWVGAGHPSIGTAPALGSSFQPCSENPLTFRSHLQPHTPFENPRSAELLIVTVVCHAPDEHRSTFLRAVSVALTRWHISPRTGMAPHARGRRPHTRFPHRGPAECPPLETWRPPLPIDVDVRGSHESCNQPGPAPEYSRHRFWSPQATRTEKVDRADAVRALTGCTHATVMNVS